MRMGSTEESSDSSKWQVHGCRRLLCPIESSASGCEVLRDENAERERNACRRRPTSPTRALADSTTDTSTAALVPVARPSVQEVECEESEQMEGPNILFM